MRFMCFFIFCNGFCRFKYWVCLCFFWFCCLWFWFCRVVYGESRVFFCFWCMLGLKWMKVLWWIFFFSKLYWMSFLIFLVLVDEMDDFWVKLIVDVWLVDELEGVLMWNEVVYVLLWVNLVKWMIKCFIWWDRKWGLLSLCMGNGIKLFDWLLGICLSFGGWCCFLYIVYMMNFYIFLW